MARIGLTPNEGGFDPGACREIANSLNHMLKHMMWAFDLVEMQKNNYKHFVPADRYRFARMLQLIPDGRFSLEFDIVEEQGPTNGQKVGVWKGTLDQLSDKKGDQRLIPNKKQCKVLLEEIFSEKELDHRVSLLKLERFSVRECFADDKATLRLRYNRALAVSR